MLNLEDLFRGNEVKSTTEKHPFQVRIKYCLVQS